MATQKELLLKALKGGQLYRSDLIAVVLSELGADHKASLVRRIDELVMEGHVRRFVADNGEPSYMLRPKRNVTQDVDLEQKIEILKEKNSDLTKKYKAALRYKELDEALIDAYATHGARMDSVPVQGPPLKPDALTYETSVSLLSDWHFWEIVDSLDTGGLAEYNMDIAAAYMQYLAEKTLHIIHDIQKGTVYREHYVFLLGDFVSTNLHAIMEHSPGTAVESLLHGQIILGWFLLDLARHFDKIHVCGVVGNHGRLKENKRYKKRYENFDYVLYNQLAIMLANQENIEFEFPKSFFQLQEVEGHEFLLWHGDDIRTWNQIPAYGIRRAVARFRELLTAHGKVFENVMMAHFHSDADWEMPLGEVMLNGSAIGTTDFSMGRLFTGNRPSQRIFSVHKEHGISWRYPIKLHLPKDCRYEINDAVPLHQQWRSILHGEGFVDPLYSDEYRGQENKTP